MTRSGRDNLLFLGIGCMSSIVNSKDKRRKHSLEKVRATLEAEGYRLLSKEYTSSNQRLEYICPKGHQRIFTFKCFLQGQRCGKCARSVRLSIEEVREKFESENYKLLTEVYKNTQQKLDFICPQGHEHSIRYGDFYTGYRCGKCAKTAKPTFQGVKAKFESEGYVLLSKEYTNAMKHLEFICPKGHYGSTNYSRFKQGHRCNQCAVDARRGEGCKRWNPLRTDQERMDERKYPEYAIWRKAVFVKHDYTCVACCNRGGDLEAHHLESYSANLHLRLEVLNGVVLCRQHHADFHQKYGYVDNTKSQFEKYLLENFGRQLPHQKELAEIIAANTEVRKQAPCKVKLPYRLDLAGKSFSKWSVVRYAGKNKWGQNIWECVCDCSTLRNVPTYMLTTNKSKSCGCKR